MKFFNLFICMMLIIGSLLFYSPVCAQKDIFVGVIDIKKVMDEWPKFQKYSSQIEEQTAAYSILFEKASPNMNDVEKEEMQYQISNILDHSNAILMEALTTEMSKAAQKVAVEKSIDMVVIKQRVTAGGTDITDDVIKLLK